LRAGDIWHGDSLPATVAPVTFAYSPCGKVVPTVVSTESFLAGLKQKKSFWGRTFPADRDAAKKNLTH
jgi:hypothetical protein